MNRRLWFDSIFLFDTRRLTNYSSLTWVKGTRWWLFLALTFVSSPLDDSLTPASAVIFCLSSEVLVGRACFCTTVDSFIAASLKVTAADQILSVYSGCSKCCDLNKAKQLLVANFQMYHSWEYLNFSLLWFRFPV